MNFIITLRAKKYDLINHVIPRGYAENLGKLNTLIPIDKCVCEYVYKYLYSVRFIL